MEQPASRATAPSEAQFKASKIAVETATRQSADHEFADRCAKWSGVLISPAVIEARALCRARTATQMPLCASNRVIPCARELPPGLQVRPLPGSTEYPTGERGWLYTSMHGGAG